MGNLSQKIEMYLKVLLDRTHNGVIEVQRSELADAFQCVPSQINYVLGTRFTPAHGYIVETRRGGGGFIRIIRLSFDSDTDFQQMLEEIIGEDLPQNQGEGILEKLKAEGILTKREVNILKKICSDSFLVPISDNRQGYLRAKIIQIALATALRDDI